MKTPKEIESLARRVHLTPSASADERILLAAQAALDDKNSMRVHEARLRGRFRMQLRITKWAIAVAALILLGIHFVGGPIDGASVTFASVLAEIRDFRPYRCRYTIEEANRPPNVRILEGLSLARRRELFPDGTIVVFDLSIPKELALDPNKMLAHERWLDSEPKRDFDLLSLVNAMQEKPREHLGTSTLEGHKVVGFHTPGDNDITLWADVHTRLPVRLDIIHTNVGRRIILDRFEFDVALDKTLFDTTAPEGYSVKKTGRGYTDIPRVGEGLPEEPLLTGLKTVAEFLDGVFPPAIDLPKLRQTMRQYITDHELSDEETEERLLPVSDYWTRAVWYLNQIRHRDGVKDLQYVGGGVRLGDSETAILWWQPQDSPTYRVVYGDLSVRDLRPEELPKRDVPADSGVR
ncbi:MAG TPA: hypothetical protein PKH24_03000 [Sedimentisphaerales bacterium]|jgi:hypothetical protein|nr:hypothetical protein [Sedimentisphaerales bacterium]HNU28025.1 hypothetical protein [Sedimentisphaerales bacterium]